MKIEIEIPDDLVPFLQRVAEQEIIPDYPGDPILHDFLIHSTVVAVDSFIARDDAQRLRKTLGMAPKDRRHLQNVMFHRWQDAQPVGAQIANQVDRILQRAARME